MLYCCWLIKVEVGWRTNTQIRRSRCVWYCVHCECRHIVQCEAVRRSSQFENGSLASIRGRILVFSPELENGKDAD